MDNTRIIQKETILIIAIILAFALFGLWLRLLPMEQLTNGSVPKVLFNDPWYSLRQIEVIAANFPLYPWFDPMNGYPTGKDIDWGPLYPTLSAAIIILFGATSRSDIIMISSWIPPLFSLIMIPILYYLGKIVSDRKTGVIAACLISVIAGEYLYRSFYGYLDHHFLETILSTGFILFYLVILWIIREEDVSIPWKNRHLIICSIIAGLFYYLGMMNMPTIILFSGIIGLFCFIHAFISCDKKSLKSLSIAHAILFGSFIILFTLTGIHQEGFNLNQYTPVHIFMALCLIIEPLYLMRVIHLMSEKSRWQIVCMSMGIPVLFFLAASFIVPSVTWGIIDGFNQFFLLSYMTSNIAEMHMWDLTRGYHSFNVTLILLATGLIISGYQIFKNYNLVRLCALIWAVIILFSTVMHVRYEYYAAVIVVLYTAISLSWLLEWIKGRKVFKSTSIIAKNGKKTRNIPISGKRFIPLIIIVGFIIIITILSAQTTWVVATKELKLISIDNDWTDALTWLEKNSPQPGIEYLKIYKKNGFQYPESSYGILSSFDYGHWITDIAKRIPITTPFHNNAEIAAQFLITTDEKSAEEYAKKSGTRYVIIDYEMISRQFSSMLLWTNKSEEDTRYQMYYYQQSDTSKNKYEPILTLRPDFFKTMLSRLYIFDGSLTNSTGARLIQYSNLQIGEEFIPVISQTSFLSPDEVKAISKKEKTQGTDIISVQYTHPIINIPALTHYRLLYESPTRIAADEYAQLYSVKIFERVGGYHIPGSGTIEIPLITNQGRTFKYQQNSNDGAFIVPYSTKRDGKGVKALGPYRNVLTGETFEVTEEQVISNS